jgi:RNase P protein component
MLELTILQQIESDPSVNSKSGVIQQGNISQFNRIEAVLFPQSIFKTTKSDNPLFGHVVIKNGMDLQSRPPSVLENAQKRNQARALTRSVCQIAGQKNLAGSPVNDGMYFICI